MLDDDAWAELPLNVDTSQAWNRDWGDVEVLVGVGTGESRAVRERVRRFVRDRLQNPPPDAYLAERLALEADF